MASQIGIPVFHSRDIKDPAALCKESLNKALVDARDVLIIDTAGRLHIDDSLMAELRRMRDAVPPKETIFVADAMTGQDAVNIAKNFNEQIGVDGIILHKDGWRCEGGAAISIRAITGKPIKFYREAAKRLICSSRFIPTELLQEFPDGRHGSVL